MCVCVCAPIQEHITRACKRVHHPCLWEGVHYSKRAQRGNFVEEQRWTVYSSSISRLCTAAA
eukprot:724688-Pelagomonas_calceolata.AAC.5